MFDKWAVITSPDHIVHVQRKWFQRFGVFAPERISLFEEVGKQISFLEKLNPDILDGYPSSIYLIAKEMKTREIKRSLQSLLNHPFSVRRKREKGDHWIHVSWKNGPTCKAVLSSLLKFNNTSHDDFMGDLLCRACPHLHLNCIFAEKIQLKHYKETKKRQQKNYSLFSKLLKSK